MNQEETLTLGKDIDAMSFEVDRLSRRLARMAGRCGVKMPDDDGLATHIELRKKLLQLLGEWRDRLGGVSGEGAKMELEAAISDLQDLMDRVP